MKPVWYGVGIAIVLVLAWQSDLLQFRDAVAAQEWDRAERLARELQVLRAVGHGSAIVLATLATATSAQE